MMPIAGEVERIGEGGCENSPVRSNGEKGRPRVKLTVFIIQIEHIEVLEQKPVLRFVDPAFPNLY
jgi:hypothetical protein